MSAQAVFQLAWQRHNWHAPGLPACLPARLQVDNWQQVDPAWLVRWIADHARDSKNVLKKPLVLEEVGVGRCGKG